MRSIWAWAIFIAWSLFFIPTIVLGLVVLSRRDSFRYAQWACRFAFSLIGVKVVARGTGNWDPDQAYVLMGNHVNFLDPFIMACAFPRKMVAIEKRENFKIPLYGFLMKRWGNIPIDRSNRHQAIKTLESAMTEFDRDAWIVVMPEGTRTRTGKMGPFKKGGFHMALSGGIPIAPYSLVGSWEVMRTGKGGWQIRPGVVEVHMHPPIAISGYDVDHMDDLMAEVRRVIGLPLGETEPVPEKIPAAVG